MVIYQQHDLRPASLTSRADVASTQNPTSAIVALAAAASSKHQPTMRQTSRIDAESRPPTNTMANRSPLRLP